MIIFTGFIVSVIAQLLSELVSVAKKKSTMLPLRKQGSRAKNWIPAGVYPAHDAGRE
jgi:hypothetical protein